ncbi:hypothetical protein IAU59_001984 [Kwoniella sp. CBS 9459]
MARHPTEPSWQASPGEIFRPPPAYAPTMQSQPQTQSQSQMHSHPQYIPHSRSAANLLYESDLIPSLPGPEGVVGHAELMGRSSSGACIPRQQQSKPMQHQQHQQQQPYNHQSLPDGGAGMTGHRRSSSFEDRFTMPRQTPFAGAPSVPRDGMTSHIRNWSTQSTETIRNVPPTDRNHSQDDVQHPDSLRPGMIRRTSSYGHPPVVRSHVEGRALGHSRTTSDSTADMSYERRGYTGGEYPDSGTRHQSISSRSSPNPNPKPNPISSTSKSGARQDQIRRSNRSTSLPQPTSSDITGSVELGSAADTLSLTRTLDALNSLTPFDRIHDPPPPAPSSRILHPFSLLTPMAIILEALVVERSMLKGEPLGGGGTLPTLRDGRGLQLFYRVQTSDLENGNRHSQSQSQDNGLVRSDSSRGDSITGGGELDWIIVKWYILSLGRIIDDLLPYLREQPSSAQEEEVVEELVKSVRAYVGKMKKVFGEVAAMYVDQYSFMRGLWDEGDMKGAAGEVGRWGDLFDA